MTISIATITITITSTIAMTITIIPSVNQTVDQVEKKKTDFSSTR